MSGDADLLVGSYLDWIRSGVLADALTNNVTELTTPFLDRHNDHLQIYSERQSEDLFLLTDDGYIMTELKSSGVERHGRRREQVFSSLLKGYGISLKGRELQVEATTSNLGQRIHNLVQAMLSIDDMFVLAQPHVEAVFLEDVENFLDENGVRYTPRVKFAGRSGLDHLFDFVIPKSARAPERILQAINSPRRDRAENLMFSVNDTRSTRSNEVAYFALINDSRREASTEIINALRTYNIKAETWSRRTALLEDLTA